jgi:hypothetical protein
MAADDIVFWFSVIVSILVALWAVIIIRAYNNVGKKD